ncbi:MAG: YDG domain-containing protein, partial [Verrucomicrobia bacterium]|nr:YDG domain-containing protein [Verrucomicrobiota bacterium]
MPILAFFPRWLLFCGWFCIHLLSCAVWSAELGQAKVSAILRDVQKTEGSKTGPAAVGDVIAGGGKIITQGQSLAELKFPDGSVIRIGNNSTFSFDPNDRTVRLDRGTALVSTPPKAEGINIVSGGVSGTVGGDPAGKTFMVTAYPAESGGAKGAPTGGFGLMVLQGSSATTVAAPSGSVSVAPGQFALVGGKMDGAPKVLAVDVGQVFRSSPLVNSFPEPLPTKSAILSTAIQQQGSQSAGGLRSTGTTGVALTSGGDLLTGGSKPPKSAGYTFEIASNLPGAGRQEKQATATEKNKDDSGLDITTAAGGPTAGGPLPVTGSTGTGGGGGSRPVFVGVNPPTITGQSGVTANPNNPNNQNNRNNLPATIVNAQVQSKPYDGLVSAIIQNGLLSGIQSGDSVALLNDTTGIFANKNVGTWSVSTAMGLSGSDSAKYSLTQPGLSGTIAAKDVTIGAGSVVGKFYDGTTGASVTSGGLSGLVSVGGVTESLGATTAVGTFASKDVGTRNVAAVYTLTDGANLASNYNLLNPTETLSATIIAKNLQISGMSVDASKVYDGMTETRLLTGASFGTTATMGLGTAGNGLAYTIDDVQVDAGGVGTYNSKDVGAATTVNFSGVTLKGNEKDNYIPIQQGGQVATITAKDVRIGSGTVGGKTYDGNVTAAVMASTTITGLVSCEDWKRDSWWKNLRWQCDGSGDGLNDDHGSGERGRCDGKSWDNDSGGDLCGQGCGDTKRGGKLHADGWGESCIELQPAQSDRNAKCDDHGQRCEDWKRDSWWKNLRWQCDGSGDGLNDDHGSGERGRCDGKS